MGWLFIMLLTLSGLGRGRLFELWVPFKPARYAGGNVDNVMGDGGDVLVECAAGIDKMAGNGVGGDDAATDVVADDEGASLLLLEGCDELGAEGVGVVAALEAVREPQG